MFTFKIILTISQSFLIIMMLVATLRETRDKTSKAGIVGCWYMLITTILCTIGVWL